MIVEGFAILDPDIPHAEALSSLIIAALDGFPDSIVTFAGNHHPGSIRHPPDHPVNIQKLLKDSKSPSFCPHSIDLYCIVC